MARPLLFAELCLLSLILRFSETILTFYFEVIIYSQEIEKIVQRSFYPSLVFPSSYILHNYCIISTPGNWHWYNGMCMILCRFIICRLTTTAIKIHNHSITTKIPLLLIPWKSWVPPMSLHLPWPPAKFYNSTISSFWECCKWNNTVRDLLRLFSLNMMSLRSIQVVCINSSFLFIAE